MRGGHARPGGEWQLPIMCVQEEMAMRPWWNVCVCEVVFLFVCV